MAAAALTIYLAGLALAFGWRSVVQWRRTGDTGLRLDAGPAGRPFRPRHRPASPLFHFLGSGTATASQWHQDHA